MCPPRWSSWRRDHPRSRGVYAGRRAGADGERGSSPLARGLHGPPVVNSPGPRIIPARAGFTRTPPTATSPCGDHPRSRGVYGRGRRPLPLRWGSSPLARGLPRERAYRRDPHRIIPARAGFTALAACGDWRPKDHPRSRGVYRRRRPSSASARGSSPLARGLQSGHGGGAVDAGIIPARAGFTLERMDAAEMARDHPRSRGVYFGRLQIHIPFGRIIPARAGFTGSRGTTGTFPSGSSPLARGLRGLR